MKQVKFDYYCDECGKKIDLSDLGAIHIINDELTTKMDEDGKGGISWYKEWDLCPFCYQEIFDRDYKKALKYFKEKDSDNDD